MYINIIKMDPIKKPAFIHNVMKFVKPSQAPEKNIHYGMVNTNFNDAMKNYNSIFWMNVAKKEPETFTMYIEKEFNDYLPSMLHGFEILPYKYQIKVLKKAISKNLSEMIFEMAKKLNINLYILIKIILREKNVNLVKELCDMYEIPKSLKKIFTYSADSLEIKKSYQEEFLDSFENTADINYRLLKSYGLPNPITKGNFNACIGYIMSMEIYSNLDLSTVTASSIIYSSGNLKYVNKNQDIDLNDQPLSITGDKMNPIYFYFKNCPEKEIFSLFLYYGSFSAENLKYFLPDLDKKKSYIAQIFSDKLSFPVIQDNDLEECKTLYLFSQLRQFIDFDIENPVYSYNAVIDKYSRDFVEPRLLKIIEDKFINNKNRFPNEKKLVEDEIKMFRCYSLLLTGVYEFVILANKYIEKEDPNIFTFVHEKIDDGRFTEFNKKVLN